MTKKEAFIKWVIKAFEPIDITTLSTTEVDEETALALEYFNELRTTTDKKVPAVITENGTKILKYMQENFEKYNNVFNSKGIGEGIFVSSRSVSGSMKKLIAEGFIEKIGQNPVSYAITEKGKNKKLNDI